MEEYGVLSYLNLKNHIKELEQQLPLIESELYNQSLHTHIAYDDTGIHTVAPRIVEMVSDNIEAVKLHKKRIERCKRRLSYFNDYVSTLPKMKQEALWRGVYDETEVLEEIKEIETAICYREGIEPPLFETIELSGSLFDDIELLAGVL